MDDDSPIRLTIDRGALVRNWNTLARIASPAECSAVVKADAYGIGIDVAVPALSGAGCRTFFVALPAEGRRVRALAPDAVVYVLDGLVGDPAEFSGGGLRPVISTMADLSRWQQSFDTTGQPAAALHVDTGMNRLGLSAREADALSTAQLQAAGICLLVSHLACADTPDHPLNLAQKNRFDGLRSRFPGVPASLCNSAGIHLGKSWHHDLVRPGIALYGGASHPDSAPEPVVTAEARILQVRQAGMGDTVGYGGAQTLTRDSRIAILGAGYADGYLRAGGAAEGRPGCQVAVGGRRAPLIGRVSMDLIAVDVTDIPGEEAAPGSWAELFGKTISIDDVASRGGTIAYELLTRLGSRGTRRTTG